MTARISRAFSFQTGVFFTDMFRMNTYEVDLSFNVETESIRDQNIAIDRVKYFLQECLSDAVLLNRKEKTAIEKYINADLKVCTLPEDPYDQIIGIMLIVKLNAIMEGKLILTDVLITSRLSDEVYCAHSLDETIGPFTDFDWWNDNSTKITSLTRSNNSKKVVKLIKASSGWDDVFLNWEDSIPAQSNSASEIVFVHFDNKTEK
jgi:hypothetical protein